jgi:hypothetical protein
MNNRVASLLFEDITVTFQASTFTKPARLSALSRIGQYVKSLTFNMPDTTQTSLPPLVNPVTGVDTFQSNTELIGHRSPLFKPLNHFLRRSKVKMSH